MTIRLSFLGAARNVTGSRYLLEAGGRRLIVDCGMYQEREFKHRNWEPFPVPPQSVDAVLFTHGHLDHVGYLPRFVKKGFKGPVYCTPATAEIARIVLLDSGHLQEEDAERKIRRHRRKKHRPPNPVKPLYTEKDAEACLGVFETVNYFDELDLGGGVRARFYDAGHILGSGMIKFSIGNNGDARTLLFSGDVGRWEKPILRNPTLFEQADNLVVESTYGDRLHKDEGSLEDGLAEAVNSTHKAGGNLLIPTFAIERAHEILYVLNALFEQKRIPPLPVFLDSPMAIRVTEVFIKSPALFDQEMREFLQNDQSPFGFKNLKMTMTAEESKAINHIKGTAIILAGSGMCTGGRIKHHLVQNISRPESTVLFTGYQARGTLGRIILESPRSVRILGEEYRVEARIAKVQGFSGHADREELLRWCSSVKEAPRRVFVTHGEEEAAMSFAKLLREELHWDVTVPEYKDEATLA